MLPYPMLASDVLKPLLFKRLRLVTTVGAALLCGSAAAQVVLPKLLSDHAVLQRNEPIHIWGMAAPGEGVAVSLHAQKQKIVADRFGRWSLYLSPEPAGGPYTLHVQASNAVDISDLMIGDVWLASGQSNMEMPLKGFATNPIQDSAKEIANANQAGVRLLHLPKRTSPFPLTDQPSSWTLCTSATAADISAAGYFFAREVAEKEHVTIGLIDSTWGGTAAETWTSLESLAADSALMPVFRTRAQLMEREVDTAAVVALEARDDAAAKAAHQPLPKHPWHPPAGSGEPGGLFNGMIAPLLPYRIKGVIWYQGEQNASGDRAPIYGRLFRTLIDDWRTRFGQGDFPFLYVQISTFQASAADSWGLLRDAQRRALALSNTAMAVSFDVGEPENIHPADKQTIGHRLALAARALGYREATEYEGPLFREVETARDGKALRVRFDHATDGFTVKGTALEGFEVAGADRRFVPATAQVDGKSVVVRADGVEGPVYVRYAWANAPSGNLYNTSGLPASTFTSERPAMLP